MEGHRSRPYLKWTALAAVALALLAVVLLFTLDLGFLRGTVEERVRQSTGRTFAIDGPLSIRLGRELRLSATDVELGNPAWAGEDRMLRIGQLDARLDTRSLITGPMVIRELRLSGLELALRQDREGRANWQFTDAAAPEEGGTSLLLEQLHLSDSTISLVSPRLDQPLRLDIAQLSQSQGEDGYLVSTLDGQLNNRPVRFEGRAGPYAQLLAGEQILIEGAGEFGQTAFSGTAQIDALAAPARPSFELTVTGPELSELTGMLGIEGLGEGPLDLEFSAAPGERTLDLKAIGRLGPLQVDAAAFVPSLQDTSNAQLDAHISGPNFGRLARLAGFPGWPERPFTLDAQVRRPGEGLEIERLDMTVADARLTLSGNIPSFPALAGAALSLSAEGRDIAPFESALGLSDLPRGAFGISGNVESGDEDSARLALDYRFPVATGRISGTLGGGADLLGTDLTISATGKDLRQLASLPEPAQLPDGPYELSTRLQIAPGSLGLQGFSLTAGTLTVKADADLPWPLDASGGRFTVQARGQDISRILPIWSGMTVRRNAFEADFKGAWTERVLTLDRATARVGEARVGGEGTLALPPSPDTTRLTLEANVPNPGQLLEADDKPWASLPLALQTSFEGTAKNLRTSALRAQLGANTVTGRLDLDLESERPRFDMALQAGTLDLRPFQPEAAANAAAPPSSRVIPDLAFPMEALASASGSFEFTAERLLLRQGAFRDVRLEGTLRDGALAVSEMGMGGFKGRLTASLDLAPTGNQARLTTRIRAQDFVLDRDGLTAEQKAASPAFTADVQLEGRGTGLRETAAGLSGSISLQSNGGRYYRTQKEGSRPKLLPAVLAAIKPELARQDSLALACVAGSASVANGRINLEPGFFAYTDKLRVVAVGSANLAHEQLDISVQTRERQTGGAVSDSFAPAIKVSGTMAAHTISLDRKATLLSGSASFLKGSLADLAKLALDQGGDSRDPCTDILKQAQGETPP